MRTFAMGIGCAALTLAWGCKHPDAALSPRPATRPTAPTSRPARRTTPQTLTPRQSRDVVPYDCTGFSAAAGPRPTRCRAGQRAVVSMVESAHALVRKLARHHIDGKLDLWSEPRERMAALAAIKLAALQPAERVVAQNAVLIVASMAIQRDAPKLARAAAKLIARLALAPTALKALPARPDQQLARFIGAPSSWRELKTPVAGVPPDTPLHHETFFAYALAFHPVRAGDTRALFGQVVAIDNGWQPHVTGIVETLELRRGLARRAPACVASIDLGRLACGAPALRVAKTPAQIPAHPFLNVIAGRVLCAGCHGGAKRASGFDLPLAAPNVQARARATRRANLLARLRRVLAKLAKLARR